jgi:hypothetical protein
MRKLIMPSGGANKLKFYTFTRNILSERLQQIRDGLEPPRTDIRHFFYEVRNKFLRENPDYPTVEHGSKTKTFYQDWSTVIKVFCIQHCEEFEIKPNRWWLLRDRLNILAKGKAICEGEKGDFIIDYTTRQRVAEDCSFILICEKATVSEELSKALHEKGYKLSLISSGGYDPADVKESVIQAIEILDVPNFFILHLHDYDLAGVEMNFTLKNHYSNVIDVGINPHFLKHLGTVDTRLVEEQALNKKFMKSLQEKFGICNMIQTPYTAENFNYLQGEHRSRKEWMGKRIEIDAIHVQYGIKPFVDYIESLLENITCWDLTRIGMVEQELYEPDNQYDYLMSEKESEVRKAYNEKLSALSKNYNRILDVVKYTLTQPTDYSDLRSKYFDGEDALRSITPLEKEYREQVERTWKPEYQRELDERVNDKLEYWDGNVSTAGHDINDIVEEIQSRLNEDKAGDSNLKEFEEKLEIVEWGKQELEAIQLPDPVEEIRKVIDALEELVRQRIP